VPPLQGWFRNRPNPGFQPGLCYCALSALGFIVSSLEAYSQQRRRKKYAALADPAAWQDKFPLFPESDMLKFGAAPVLRLLLPQE
jgi:hypothetical protein